LRAGQIIIAVDHACMNKLKEKKPKNYDASSSALNTTTLVKNDLDIY
jgi:hypothetical protein